jgi:hypothetical protein
MRAFRFPLPLPLLPAALLVVLALASSCRKDIELTNISTLMDDPSHYDHQVVHIGGTVSKALGVMGYGAYEVDDGTGRIAVVTTTNGAPREGAEVGVEGEFRSAFTLGDKVGAAILEHERFTPKHRD